MVMQQKRIKSLKPGWNTQKARVELYKHTDSARDSRDAYSSPGTCTSGLRMKTPRSPEHNKHFLYFCCLRHIGHVANAGADKQHLVGVRRRRKFLYKNGNAPLLPSH